MSSLSFNPDYNLPGHMPRWNMGLTGHMPVSLGGAGNQPDYNLPGSTSRGSAQSAGTAGTPVNPLSQLGRTQGTGNVLEDLVNGLYTTTSQVGGTQVVNDPLSGRQQLTGNVGGVGWGLNQQADVSGPLLDAVRGDAADLQGLMDQQWLRNEMETQNVRQGYQGAVQTVTGAADQAGTEMRGYGRDLQEFGDRQMEEFRKQVGGGRERIDRYAGQVQGYLEKGEEQLGRYMRDQIGRAEDSMARYEKSIGEFEDRTAHDVQVVAEGIRNNAMRQKEMLGGMQADGTPMHPTVRAQMEQSIEADATGQVYQAATGMLSQYNQTRVQLEGNLAGMGLNVAQLYGVAGQSLGQFQQGSAAAMTQLANTYAGYEARVGDQLVQRLGGQAQLEQFASGVMMQAAQLENAARVQAAALDVQGRTEVARLVSQNPRHTVSQFQALMAFEGARRSLA